MASSVGVGVVASPTTLATSTSVFVARCSFRLCHVAVCQARGVEWRKGQSLGGSKDGICVNCVFQFLMGYRDRPVDQLVHWVHQCLEILCVFV